MTLHTRTRICIHVHLRRHIEIHIWSPKGRLYSFWLLPVFGRSLTTHVSRCLLLLLRCFVVLWCHAFGLVFLGSRHVFGGTQKRKHRIGLQASMHFYICTSNLQCTVHTRTHTLRMHRRRNICIDRAIDIWYIYIYYVYLNNIYIYIFEYILDSEIDTSRQIDRISPWVNLNTDEGSGSRRIETLKLSWGKSNPRTFGDLGKTGCAAALST